MSVDRRAYSTDDFCKAFSIGKTKLYEMLASGTINARKVDGRTIITHDEAERWLSALPSFTAAKRPGGPGRGSSTPQAA